MARGRRLAAPGEGTRPLSDRVKQTLFAIVEPEIRGRPFLDLFAGSGAGGIEALSRGAASAVFVERDRAAARFIERNLRTAALARRAGDGRGEGRHRLAPAARTPRRTPSGRSSSTRRTTSPSSCARHSAGIADAGPGGVLAADGVVVAKHFWKRRRPRTGCYDRSASERFGDTQLTFYRWADADAGEEDG